MGVGVGVVIAGTLEVGIDVVTGAGIAEDNAGLLVVGAGVAIAVGCPVVGAGDGIVVGIAVVDD